MKHSLPLIVASLLIATPAFAQTSSTYLSRPIARRCAVIGDSNAGYVSRQILEEGQHLAQTGTPVAPVVTFDFVGMVYGSGLRDLQALQTRLADTRIDWAEYDCAVVNLGLADVLVEDANWSGFFNGSVSSIGPAMAYHARVQAVLSAIPSSVPHIYWIAPHSASTLAALHPWEIAAVDLTIACFDDPVAWSGWCPGVEDTRLHFVNPDPLISTANPKLVDNLHYSPASGTLIYRHVVTLIGAQP